MAESLRLYDKDIQDRFPNNKVNKHIHPDDLNKLINEFIEKGEHSLGVEIVRLLDWKTQSKQWHINLLEDAVSRYEAYSQMEIDNEFEVIRMVTWRKFKTELLNELFFIFQKQGTITYAELKNLIEVITL